MQLLGKITMDYVCYRWGNHQPIAQWHGCFCTIQLLTSWNTFQRTDWISVILTDVSDSRDMNGHSRDHVTYTILPLGGARYWFVLSRDLFRAQAWKRNFWWHCWYMMLLLFSICKVQINRHYQARRVWLWWWWVCRSQDCWGHRRDYDEYGGDGNGDLSVSWLEKLRITGEVDSVQSVTTFYSSIA